MKKILIVVDMQNDFIDGSLGTPEAVKAVENATKEIDGFDGEIIVTFDTHFGNYLDTAEGKKLPIPHCIDGTKGWELNGDIRTALGNRKYTAVSKGVFGVTDLPELIKEKAGAEDFSVELIGLCTDICVITNALLLKANFPEAPICVKADCCAGVTPELHEAALAVMKSCQIDII